MSIKAVIGRSMSRGVMCAFVTLAFLGGAVATAQAGPNGWSTGGKKPPPPPPPVLASLRTVFRSGYAIIECERDYKEFGKPWVYVNCKVIAWIVNPNNKAVSEICTTKGAASGEIVADSNKISYAAISGEGTAAPSVGFEASLKFAFECGNVKFEAKGAVIGEINPIRTPTDEYTAVFAANEEGHQAVTSFEGGKPTQLDFKATEGRTKTKWEPGVVESTEQLVTEVPTELRSDAEWKLKEKEEKKKEKEEKKK